MQPLSSLLDLSDKIVLITGGAAGIGLAIAHRYAEAGATLILIDRDEAGLEKAKTELTSAYDITVHTSILNLLDAEAIRAFWQNLPATPDILINNAGVFVQNALPDITDANYDFTMNINTRAVLLMCQQMILTRGKTNPGIIVNISSIEAMHAMTPKMLTYGMSKAAILSLTRGLTEEYTPHGWRINTILPGGITTPGARNIGIQALKHLDFSIIKTGMQFNARLPFKRMGTPDDIARAVLFIGSPASEFIAGSDLVVDGGFLAV